MKYFYLVLAAILAINALMHLLEGNLLRALLSGFFAVVFFLEATGKPTLGKLRRGLSLLWKGLMRIFNRE
jgi:hypothetical protein